MDLLETIKQTEAEQSEEEKNPRVSRILMRWLKLINGWDVLAWETFRSLTSPGNERVLSIVQLRN